MTDDELMSGFPPRPEGQVSLANWRKAPFNKWSFQHVREIVPSADIPNDPGRVWDLPDAPVDLSTLRISARSTELDFSGFLEATDTDGFLVLHRGRIVCEVYRSGMTASTPHILMSVSKSVLGLLAGIVAHEGALDLTAPVVELVPELAESAYRGATVRDLLDMRAGIAFDEDYLATSGPIIEYRKAQNWDPLLPGDPVSDLRSFFAGLRESHGTHNGAFHYVSPNTDLLGWVIERATRSPLRRSRQRAHLAAARRQPQRLYHGRPAGRAALRGRHVHDDAGPRAAWAAHCTERRARRPTDHPRGVDRRHLA